MTRRSGFLLAAGTTLLLMLLVAAAALSWLLTTGAGFQWALERARPFLPETVSFAEAQGRLIGPIELRGLRVEAESADVHIDRVRLRWRPRALLGGRVHVERLTASGVEVRQAPAEQADAHGPSVPKLPREVPIPLPITVEQLAIEDVGLHLLEGPERRLEHLRARVEVGSRTLRVVRLSVSAPEAEAKGRLSLGMRSPYAIDARIDWRIRPSGPVAPMAGHLALDGSLENLALTQLWREPSTARLSANLRLFGDDPQWRARFELPETAAADWWATAPGLAATAYLSLHGSMEHAFVAGTIDLAGLPAGRLRTHLDARADFAARRLTLERVRVEPERPASWLRASGTAELDGSTPRVDLTLAWGAIAWPLRPEMQPVAVSESGSLRVTGTPEHYRIDGHGRLWAPAMGADPARMEWQGRGSTAGMEALQLRARWGGAELKLDGEARWAAAHHARFDFALRGLDPARFDESLSGRLQARGSMSAEWRQAPEARLALRDLSGELNGRPVDGQARVAWIDDRLHLDDVRLAAGDARLRATGAAAGERVAVEWSLTVPRLAQLFPGAEGRIDGEGRVSGDPAAPTLRLDVTANAIRIGSAAIGAARLHGELDQAGNGPSRLSLRVRALQAGDTRVRRLAADLNGRRAEHRLGVQVEAEGAAANLVLTGGLDGVDWRGRLERADLMAEHAGRWRLQAPASLVWRAQRFELARVCWLSDGAHACLQGAGRPGDWRASIDAGEIAVARIAGLWRPDLAYEGDLGLAAEFAQQGGGPITGEARLRVSPGRVTGTIGDVSTQLVEYGAGELQATLAPTRLDAKLALPFAGGGRLAVTIGLERNAPRALAGRVRAELHDFGLVAELVPQIGRAQGRLRADLQLDGTLSAPRVSGTAGLDAGELSVPDLGIEVREVTLDVHTLDRAITAEMSAESGQGTLSATMQLSHVPETGWRGEGRVAGASFTAVDLPELHAVVSPDLAWRLVGREIAVEGRVTIPAARIEPRDLSDTVQVSPDAVIVRPDGERSAAGVPEVPEPAGWRVRANVRVVIGDDVRIDAFGLDADLGGDLRIVQEPGQLTSATGELSVVEGSYTIYRQTLTVERGRVIFTGGPLSDPGLDIRAVRRPRNVLVGVNVRGTLRQPRVELFSEPPMEESQVLSYLVVGLPFGETSSGERSSVAAAAAALASSRQGERIASELGIDEVTLEEEQDTQGASLVLGRYLSPRLYIGYGIGLLEQADSVRLRYELSRRWTLETESGTTSSADLLYSIETD